ncbi:MAG: hypothetical protein ABSA16_08250 [Thermoguttaceae bacterium]|jgi:hypothetical protein
MKNSDIEQRKRELRLRIGRMRRRIDNRLHAAGQQARRLVSWREYVNRYPGYAMLAAFGVGLAASGGFWRGQVLRRSGLRLVSQTAEQAGRHLFREIQRLWSQSGAKP